MDQFSVIRHIRRHTAGHLVSLVFVSLFFLLPILSNFIFAQTIPESAYAGMRWRLIGPYRAGWASVAVGVPEQPNTFYSGAVDGGVWKTEDAGRTWQALMQHEKAASIGAMAVAASNPNILYVGTGQVTMRYDIASGNGV